MQKDVKISYDGKSYLSRFPRFIQKFCNLKNYKLRFNYENNILSIQLVKVKK